MISLTAWRDLLEEEELEAFLGLPRLPTLGSLDFRVPQLPAVMVLTFMSVQPSPTTVEIDGMARPMKKQ